MQEFKSEDNTIIIETNIKDVKFNETNKYANIIITPNSMAQVQINVSTQKNEIRMIKEIDYKEMYFVTECKVLINQGTKNNVIEFNNLLITYSSKNNIVNMQIERK